MKKFIKLKVSIILSVLLVIALIFNILNWRKEKMGVIDAQYLVSIEAQKLATHYPKGDVPQEKLQSLVNHLRKTVELYAEKNKVILLSKNAVMGGKLPDYTDVLLEALKEENEE